MKVTPVALPQAGEFLRRVGYVPPLFGDLQVFLATCPGNDIQMLQTEECTLLLVLKHDQREQTTYIRAAAKEGTGDAMALAYAAFKSGQLFSFPTVKTGVPVERLRDKLTGFTAGAADGQVVTFAADVAAARGSNV